MKKNHPESPWKAIGLIGSLGMELLILVVAGAYLGRKLDEHFQSEPIFLAVGVLGGFAAGIIGAVFTIRRLIKNL